MDDEPEQDALFEIEGPDVASDLGRGESFEVEDICARVAVELSLIHI